MIGVALIGYGAWGPNLARNLADAEARLVAVCDRRADRAAAAVARYPQAETAANWVEIVRNPGVDAVVLATPPSTHFAIAEACLAAGKHILVEKPITTNRRDAARLVDLAAERRLVLMVDHTFLYTPEIATIRALIATGQLGQPRLVDSVRVGPRAPVIDTGAVWDLAPHDLAIVDHLFGLRPERISATATGAVAGAPVEEARLTLDYPSGLTVQVHVGWRSPVKVRTVRIAGDRGTVTFDDMEPLHKVKIEGAAAPIDAGPSSRAEPLASVCRDFLDCIATGRRAVSDGRLGLRVVEILEVAAASLAAGGRALTFSDGSAKAGVR